ncbi:MAG: hypothetical protein ACJAR2_002583 [Ilumatobacter sp.]|jgi:hypothetical protein
MQSSTTIGEQPLTIVGPLIAWWNGSETSTIREDFAQH